MTSTLTPSLALCSVIAVLAGAADAQQHSILFATSIDETSLRPGGYETILIRPDEVAQVTPAPGTYTAAAFLTVGAQWAYVGDKNSNGRLVDYDNDAPGLDTDAVFVKRFRAGGNHGPRDIYVSKESTAGLAPNDEDGSVFRYSAQGVLEIFISENQVLNAIGQATTSDCNLDAICQDDNGDLYVSFHTTESINGTNVTDGGIVRIPASGLNFNLQGNVVNSTAGSAEIVAEETHVGAWITQSGVQSATRRNPSTSIDITGLEIDPRGGTWTSPVTSRAIPNLMFTWDSSDNDGAVLSTRSGGEIARVNGIALGSTRGTTGAQIGLLPFSSGINGLAGLALVPRQAPPPAVETWPVNLVTSGTTLYTRQEVSNATPGGNIVFFLDTAVGSTFPANTFPLFRGQLFGSGLIQVVGVGIADSHGFAASSLVMPPAVINGARFAVAWQAIDVGSLTLATPSAMQFQ